MTQTPDQIAAALSEAQRRAVIDGRWLGSGVTQMFVVDFTEPWPAPIAQFLTLGTDRLNDLGLAVRAILERTNQP